MLGHKELNLLKALLPADYAIKKALLDIIKYRKTGLHRFRVFYTFVIQRVAR